MTRSESPHGLVIVDKPSGCTSHDVVARMRRIAQTRKVGHAGTLDPMATGVLVLGLGKGTKLLGHLTCTEKVYSARMRLGQSTSTDDAEGELWSATSADQVGDTAIHSAVAGLTGELQQLPPQFSAIKVAGKRAYASARAGEKVNLQPRSVTVAEFTVTDIQRVTGDSSPTLVDVDATVRCSSGTYVRALARDLGAQLGLGGHLTALRRTRVGAYDLDQARSLDELALACEVMPLRTAVAAAFPQRALSEAEAQRIVHGNRIATAELGPGPIGLFDPAGEVVALGEERGEHTKPSVVFA